MKIIVNVNDETIRRAAALTIRHHADPEFLRRVASVPYFYHTEHSPEAVAGSIKFYGESAMVFIEGYKSINPFSKAIGYADGNTVFFNLRKTGSLYDRIETIMHEITHLCGYSHKGNFVNAYNLKTVPYVVGGLFKDYIKEKGVDVFDLGI